MKMTRPYAFCALTVAMTIGGVSPALAGPAKRVHLKCAPVATYTAASTGVPAMVDVTYRGVKPTSAVAQAAVEKCLREAADTMFVTAEVMGTAWFGRSEKDDDAVTFPDGSINLVYDPKTKHILTGNQRDGDPPAVVSSGAGYVASYQAQRAKGRAGPSATVSVIFATTPTEKRSYETLIAEATKAVQGSKGSLPVSTYAYTGNQKDPASWKGIKGANGKFIHVEFDPKRPGRLSGPADEDLGVQLQIR